MITIFDFLYVQGYTAALLDVLRVFDCIQLDLKIHKRKQNYKTYKGIVEAILSNRTILRENPDAFIRCNDNAENGFELWFDKRK